MKKFSLGIFVIILTSTVCSVKLLAAETNKSNNNSFQLDYGVYSRVVDSIGNSLSVSDSNTVNAMWMRFRPFFNLKKNNFTARVLLGVDVYFGHSKTGQTYPGGGGTPASFYTTPPNFGILESNIGYSWNNGIYVKGGLMLLSIPGLVDDYNNPGITIGWKNKNIDIQTFYFGLTLGDPLKGNQMSGYFGVSSTINVKESITFKPFLVGLFQRKNAYLADSSCGDPAAFGKFLGGIGVYPGIEVDYTADSGLFATGLILGAFGHNDIHTDTVQGSQKRVAVEAAANFGFKIEQLASLSLFFDFRSGAEDAYTQGTNHSFNGATIDPDSYMPPLFIIYKNNTGRFVPAYGTTHLGDGYAYSDRGIVAFGVSGSMRISDFNIGLNLGYGAYTAGTGSKSIGFEVDLDPRYYLQEDFSIYTELGILFAGEGLKSLVKGNTRNPFLINIGMEYKAV